MTKTRDQVLHPTQSTPLVDFPHAPDEWKPAVAEALAEQYEIVLDEDHWTAIRGLQEYYARHPASTINVRQLLDALNEKFHAKGGMKFLYQLLPGGPVAQGCRLAGLTPPAGAIDKGFGSVQ